MSGHTWATDQREGQRCAACSAHRLWSPWGWKGDLLACFPCGQMPDIDTHEAPDPVSDDSNTGQVPADGETGAKRNDPADERAAMTIIANGKTGGNRNTCRWPSHPPQLPEAVDPADERAAMRWKEPEV